MELLKKIPYNFRYYIFTTRKKQIIIVFAHSNTDIDDNTPTILETSYIPILKSSYDIDDSQTIKVSCKDDELMINDFNNDIRKYCASRQNFQEFRIYSGSPEYKMMFEELTIRALFKSCKSAYFEIGNSVFRTGKEDYGQLKKLDVKSGTWFIDQESTFYVDEFHATDVIIDCYNRKDTPSILNFVVRDSFKGIRMMIYSTIQMVILNSSKTQEQFLNGKINFAYVKVFGEEFVNDNEQPRIEFRGFEKVSLGCIEVSEEVKYGNILYVDNLTKFTVMRIKRRIAQIDKGSFIQIDRVGSVNITDIRYVFTNNSTLVPGAAIITFLHNDDDKLERSLNIYNTTVQNTTGNLLVIVRVVKTNIKKIYISKCFLSNDIQMVDKDEESKVTKFNYNECNFSSTGDFVLSNIISISLNNMQFDVQGALKITCPFVTINGGTYNVKKFLIDNKDEIVSKVVMNNVLIDSEEVNINNTKAINDEDFIFYDNDCTIKADKYTINGYKPSFNRTVFKCKIINLNSLTVVTFSNCNFDISLKETLINIYGSLAGVMNLLSHSNDDNGNKFRINIQDKNFYRNINMFELHGTIGLPELNLTTNTPIKVELHNMDPEYVYFAYTDKIESLQKSKIIHKFNALSLNENIKVINNSEKLCSISNYMNEERDLVFEIEKK